MEASKDSCPICLEGLTTSASYVQPCNHSFCNNCITKWTDQNSTCPCCLKEIESIKKRISPEEDTKEQFEILKISPSGPKKMAEEEFECFDHNYFVTEFRELFKQIKEAEIRLKTQLSMKRKTSKAEEDHQLTLHMKQEVEMKLNFLGRVKKINPRDLLEDIQHKLDLLRKINYSEQPAHRQQEFTYIEDVHYDDDYDYEDPTHNVFSVFTVASTKGTKNKKKNKNKAKNNKESCEFDKAPQFMYT